MPLTLATRPGALRAAAIVAVALTGFAGAVWVGERAVGASGDIGVLLAAGDDTIVVAHRGGASIAPENTLPAIEAAVASGADLVELDVQLSADGIPVLMHDWTIDRTTEGSGPAWSLPAASLTALEAGAESVHVPTLREALQAIASTRASTMLELKGSWTAEQVAAVAALVAEQSLEHRVVLASFDLFTLRAARDAAPELPRLLLTRSLASISVAVADVAASAIGISAPNALRDPAALSSLADEGIGVFIYTLNTPEGWADAMALNARGMITDDPVALRSWLVSVGDGPYNRDTSAR